MTIFFSSNSQVRLLVLVASVLISSPSLLFGQTWTGASTTSSNWSDTSNWDSGLFVQGSTLIFAGSARTTNTNTFAAGTFYNLRFDSAASAFTLNGNALKLGSTTGDFPGPGSIDFSGNPSAPITHTINLDLQLGDVSTITTRSNGSILITGQISGGNNLIKAGSGTLSLTNSSNNYSGTTSITGGTLQLGNGTATGVLSTSSAISISNGATFAINQSDIVKQGTEFSGADITGQGGLTQAGSGTTVLTAGNSYTGNTNITNGTLQLGDNGEVGALSANSDINIDSGATFSINRTNTVKQGTDFSSTEITGAGGLTQAGSGTTILTAANSYIGNTNINNGTLQLGDNGLVGALSANSAINIQSGATFSINRTNSVQQGTDFSSAAITGQGGFNQAGSGTTVLTAANSYSGNTTITGGTLQLGSGSADGSLSTSSAISVSSGATFSINQSDTVTQGTEFSGAAITGAGGLTQAGGGKTILTAANAYTGATNITNGTLQLGNGGSTGTLATNSAINVGSGAIFAISRSNDVVQGVDFSGAAITGNGGFTQDGTGTTTLNATNSYKGETKVLQGTLVINGNHTNATGAITVSSGAKLLTGTGALLGGTTTVNGTLTGNGTFAGNTIINGIHSPGNSPGLQTFNGDLAYNTNSTLKWELIANTTSGRGVNFDAIDVNGNLTFNGATGLDLFFNTAGSTVDWNDAFWNTNRSWLIFDVAGTTTGLTNFTINTSTWLDKNGNAFNTARSGSSFSISQSGSDVFLDYGNSAVPEPSSLILLSMAGLLGGGRLVKRYMRRNKKALDA